MLKEVTMLRAERPRVRDDEAPPRMMMRGEFARIVLTMQRGSWVQDTHVRAKSLQRAVRQLGGQATVYKTSDLFSVCKILEAPWMQGLDSPRATGS